MLVHKYYNYLLTLLDLDTSTGNLFAAKVRVVSVYTLTLYSG